MKISKRAREQAAMICALVASGDVDPPRPCPCLYCVTDWLGFDRTARELADAARVATGLRTDEAGPGYGIVHAHAEALLRTGWSPP